MIRAHHLGDDSTFIGQTCALCKQEFVPGDDIVVCPEDGSRHHVHCWQANDNRCTAYGCTGAGAIGTPAMLRPRPRPTSRRPAPRVITQERERPRNAGAVRPVPGAPGSKVRTLPAGSIGCARTCLLLAIAIAIILFALGCYGLWAIADFWMLQVLDEPYREPLFEGLIQLPSLLVGPF